MCNEQRVASNEQWKYKRIYVAAGYILPFYCVEKYKLKVIIDKVQYNLKYEMR